MLTLNFKFRENEFKLHFGLVVGFILQNFRIADHILFEALNINCAKYCFDFIRDLIHYINYLICL